MTAPAAARQLTAAQIAQVVVLLRAQALMRSQTTQTAIAAAVLPLRSFTAWWDADAVRRVIDRVLRVVQPAQLRAARSTDAFTAQVMSIVTGQRVQPAGAVDVNRLRRTMREDVVRDLVAGRRRPAFVELGNNVDGPGPDINRTAGFVVHDGDDEFADPADAYGRVADGYRYNVVARGDSPEAAAEKAIVRIAAIAQTDITLAIREQYHRSLNRSLVDGWRRILRPDLGAGGPPCGLCVVAADRVYKREDLQPIHANCVPAGTRVAADGVRSVTRRRYTGVLVVLHTASGQELRITANHPVLTDQGWIPAHLVGVGHHVVRHRVGHGVVGRSPDEHDGPPLVEEVWRSAAVHGSLHRRVVPVTAQDFHGDGTDCEVDVVSADGRLARVGDVSFVQPAREPAFVSGHPLGPRLPGGGGGLEAMLNRWPATDRRVGCPHQGLAVLGGGVGVALEERRGGAANGDAVLLEAQPDYGPFDAVLPGQRQLGGTGLVFGDDVRIGQNLADAPRFDPAFAEFSGQGRHAYAELGRNLLNRLAGHVELDRVVDQRLIEGTHDVFNLHTDEGWYSANNVIVSNCRCEVLPIIAGWDPGITINGPDLEAIYQAAGGTGGDVIGSDGKRHSGRLKALRVALTEHGELGPILVDANQHTRGPREVARTMHPDRSVRARAQLESLERSLAELEGRVGTDNANPAALEWQRAKVEELRRELANA